MRRSGVGGVEWDGSRGASEARMRVLCAFAVTGEASETQQGAPVS